MKAPIDATTNELIVWLSEISAGLRQKIPPTYELGHERGVGMLLMVDAMQEFLSGRLDETCPPENREALSAATSLMWMIWREVQDEAQRRNNQIAQTN